MRRAATLLATLLIAGCATQQEIISDHESLLSASGFAVLPANTPERQAQLARLPAGKVTQVIEGDRVTYLFPDPVVCHCLYIGGQPQWMSYQAYRQAHAIANEQVLAAQLNWDAGWGWGPWGGYGGWWR